MSQDPRLLSAEQFLLATLVGKLAVMAALATMLARYRRFRHILIFEQRGWPDRLALALGLTIPLTVGVISRLLLNYDAADLMLEGALLAGLIAGPYTGAIVGGAIAFPGFVAGEWGAIPFAVGCGFTGGGFREVTRKADIWSFSPFAFLRLPGAVWQLLRDLSVDRQVALLFVTVGLEAIRQGVGHRYGEHRLFFFDSPSYWLTVVVYVATVLTVSIPIKIWNNARIEHRLQEQEKLLLAAKVEALKSQINPHFLFNTLASVSALIRSQPETARTVILKLSALLRRLLRMQEQFVTLREELDAVDEYLDIEVIRFGPRLSVRKDTPADTLDLIVPSMILQPLVENAIKHGLSRKVGAGHITLRSRRQDEVLVLEVEDDGLGISEERAQTALTRGIGLSNVDERLRVIFGATARMALRGSPGRGAVVRLEIPVVLAPVRATA